MSIIVNSSTF